MDWLFVCLALVPVIFCPMYLFNGFMLPQVLAVSLLSAASVVMGVWKGDFCFSAPTYLIIIFLLYILLSAIRTKPIHNARKELGMQVPFLLLFLILPFYINDQSIKIFTIMTSIIGLLISVYAIGQTMGFDPFFSNKIKKGGPVKNAIGTIGNPNFLSSYFSGIFWLTIYAGVNYHPACFLASALILASLFKTKSRAGQVAIIGSLIFFVLYQAKMGWLLYPEFIFNIGMIFIILGIIILGTSIKDNWELLWKSKIDPNAEKNVWFATFRYRLCYWLVALHLIKKRPLFGWGLWSFRREVYEGQAELNDKYPGFMDSERYITPQPRECHNDWIEHVFEYGIVGAGIFFLFVGCIVGAGIQISTNISNLILLTSLISIIINATFFFALRIPSTSIYFWMTCAILLGLSGMNIEYSIPFNSHLIAIGLIPLFVIFLWDCVIKRVITSRLFMKSIKANGMDRYGYLCEAMFFSPDETTLRTHAMIATADYAPVLSTIHASKAMENYDGQITHWAVIYDYVLSWLKGYHSFFDIMTFQAKRGHYLLNYFEPVNQLLSGKGSISLKTQYQEGATMRVMEEAQLWKIRTFVSNMESLNKDVILLNKEAENFQLRIQNAKQQFELAKTSVENLVLYEKKRMNIPDNWIFDTEEGVFKDPAVMSPEQRKKFGLEG